MLSTKEPLARKLIERHGLAAIGVLAVILEASQRGCVPFRDYEAGKLSKSLWGDCLTVARQAMNSILKEPFTSEVSLGSKSELYKAALRAKNCLSNKRS